MLDISLPVKSVLLQMIRYCSCYQKVPNPVNWKQNFKLLMDSVEDYARQWAKRENIGVDTLSEWVKNVRSLVQIQIKKITLYKGR